MSEKELPTANGDKTKNSGITSANTEDFSTQEFEQTKAAED